MEKLDSGKQELHGIELIDGNSYIFMTFLFKIFLIFYFSKHKEICPPTPPQDLQKFGKLYFRKQNWNIYLFLTTWSLWNSEILKLKLSFS